MFFLRIRLFKYIDTTTYELVDWVNSVSIHSHETNPARFDRSYNSAIVMWQTLQLQLKGVCCCLTVALTFAPTPNCNQRAQ